MKKDLLLCKSGGHSRTAATVGDKAAPASIFLFRERKLHLVFPNERPKNERLDREMAPVEEEYNTGGGRRQEKILTQMRQDFYINSAGR